MTEYRYTARFIPQVWDGDILMDLAAGGPDEWDCTAYAAEHAEYVNSINRRQHSSLDDPDGVPDDDDWFQEDPAAPEWVRAYRGPFSIRISRVVLDSSQAMG